MPTPPPLTHSANLTTTHTQCQLHHHSHTAPTPPPLTHSANSTTTHTQCQPHHHSHTAITLPIPQPHYLLSQPSHHHQHTLSNTTIHTHHSPFTQPHPLFYTIFQLPPFFIYFSFTITIFSISLHHHHPHINCFPNPLTTQFAYHTPPKTPPPHFCSPLPLSTTLSKYLSTPFSSTHNLSSILFPPHNYQNVHTTLPRRVHQRPLQGG